MVLADCLAYYPNGHSDELQAESELKKLQQIYSVYAEHVGNVRQYSELLWADLDLNKMVTGTEEVARKLRELKHLKLLPAFEAVERDIQSFQSSLPLMQELRNDALRKRHWDQLMTVTGVPAPLGAGCLTHRATPSSQPAPCSLMTHV